MLAKFRAGWEAKHPSGNKSGEAEGDDGNVSSGWSVGEGSSEDISSVDEQTAAVKSATAQDTPTTGANANQPKLLLVGDSNAVGYCETHDYNNSLQKRLRTAIQVHVAA